MSELKNNNDEPLEQKKELKMQDLNRVAGGSDRWYKCVVCGNRAKMNSDYENSIYNRLKCPKCGGEVVRN